MTHLPNLNKSLRCLTLVDEVYNRLIGNNGFWAMAIKHAVDRKRPYAGIINTIRSTAEDNRQMVVGMIGEQLTNEILNW